MIDSGAGIESAKSKLIIALDVPDAKTAQNIVQQLGESVGIYKVGLQLFTAEGPSLIRDLTASGRRVFLDLKLHDIPNTVAHAVKSVAALGPSMITVHASGGISMLRAAVEAANGQLTVWAVTVLTSMGDHELQATGIAGDCAAQVLRLATLARTAGCSGVIASPRETLQIRKLVGPDFHIVNPGIRPYGSAKNDQERTSTPAEAIAAGASHIVVGRPVTGAANRVAAANAILEEMEKAAFHGL